MLELLRDDPELLAIADAIAATQHRKGGERTPAGASQTVYWVIAVLLAVIATALWVLPGDPLLRTATAQNQPLAGARGVFAFTGQLDRDRYGLFMLDVDQGTIWCYEMEKVW